MKRQVMTEHNKRLIERFVEIRSHILQQEQYKPKSNTSTTYKPPTPSFTPDPKYLSKATPVATNTAYTPPTLHTPSAESTSTPTINAPVITKAPSELEARQQHGTNFANKTPNVYKDTNKQQMQQMAQGNELLSLMTNRGNKFN